MEEEDDMDTSRYSECPLHSSRPVPSSIIRRPPLTNWRDSLKRPPNTERNSFSSPVSGTFPWETVLPEGFVGGYPKWNDFGIVLGTRSAEGREEYARLAGIS